MCLQTEVISSELAVNVDGSIFERKEFTVGKLIAPWIANQNQLQQGISDKRLCMVHMERDESTYDMNHSIVFLLSTSGKHCIS